MKKEKEVTQWEYKRLINGDGNDEAILNELGDKGWETVGINSKGTTLLKRPKGIITMELEETIVNKPKKVIDIDEETKKMLHTFGRS